MSSKISIRVNDQIRGDVRLIDESGQMVGVLSAFDALARARRVSLDLVEIVPNSLPPTCKIMDFGKYKYEQQKKVHAARQKQKIVEVKEVKLRPNIDGGDYDVKLRNVKKFIANGDKVKVLVVFRGREVSHSSVGFSLINKLLQDVSTFAKVDTNPKLEGKQIIAILSPVPVLPVGKKEVENAEID